MECRQDGGIDVKRQDLCMGWHLEASAVLFGPRNRWQRYPWADGGKKANFRDMENYSEVCSLAGEVVACC